MNHDNRIERLWFERQIPFSIGDDPPNPININSLARRSDVSKPPRVNVNRDNEMAKFRQPVRMATESARQVEDGSRRWHPRLVDSLLDVA
jgi:hypothetical protein